MPICAACAGVVCLLLKEGMVCDALRRRDQDDHAHYNQKDLRILFHRTGSISSDKYRLILIDLDLKKNATNDDKDDNCTEDSNTTNLIKDITDTVRRTSLSYKCVE